MGMLGLKDSSASSVLPTGAGGAPEPYRTARKRQERRQLGAYYTPERLSQILAFWAIRSADDTVLEPSFGGCGFVAAARSALDLRGAADPTSSIYGCDIDPVAFEYLSEELGTSKNMSNFALCDFMESQSITGWPKKFAVVLANPPYIPHHRIGKARVKELSRRRYDGLTLGGRASLWAYFLAQALKMLKDGGRMAWVLPGAFLQADYAQPLRDAIANNFKSSIALIVRERIFLTEGTDEETVIVLASGYRQSSEASQLNLAEAKGLEHVPAAIAAWEMSADQVKKRNVSAATLGFSHEVVECLSEMAALPHVHNFGKIAKVQIGIVTGANSFFVLSRSQLENAGINEAHCDNVLSKFQAAPGIELNSYDIESYAMNGGRSFLISSEDPDSDHPFRHYLSGFSASERSKVSTFRKRKIWSRTCDGNIPDAFFPVMHHTGPRLVLNNARCNCTNTIHRVFFSGDLSEKDRKLASISMISTYSQVSAELTGRRYGSGVLKHEPRDAERISIIMPQRPDRLVDQVYAELDSMLRAGEYDLARTKADQFLLADVDKKIAQDWMRDLSPCLSEMRIRRRPARS